MLLLLFLILNMHRNFLWKLKYSLTSSECQKCFLTQETRGGYDISLETAQEKSFFRHNRILSFVFAVKEATKEYNLFNSMKVRGLDTK